MSSVQTVLNTAFDDLTGVADAQRFRGIREAGINRLSMGIQSFQSKTLKALGREHDGPMAEFWMVSAKT